MSPPQDIAPAAPKPRLVALDLARGIAILAMIVFHFAYDLSQLGLIEADIAEIPAWIWFSRAIAASFLGLAGVSLVLAHARGFDRAAFLKRLARVAGAAALVTLGSWWAFPERFVYFGILHMIALGSVLALPFLRLPPHVTLLAALAALALPFLMRLEPLSAGWVAWLGLGTSAPATMDFVPVFPWFAPILLGIALARLVPGGRLATLSPGAAPARLLALAGRHSLVIYLIHQPLLYGALMLVAMALAPRIEADAEPFVKACQEQCQASGGERAKCMALCICAVDALKSEGLWSAAIANRLDDAGKARAEALSRRCAETAAPLGRP